MKSPYATEHAARESKLDQAAGAAAHQLLVSICDAVEAEVKFSKSVRRLGNVEFTDQFFVSNLMTRIREQLILAMLNCGTDYENAVLGVARSIHPYSSHVVPASDTDQPVNHLSPQKA